METRGKRHLPTWMLQGNADVGPTKEDDQSPLVHRGEEKLRFSDEAPDRSDFKMGISKKKSLERRTVANQKPEDLRFPKRKSKRGRTLPDEKLTVDDLVSIAEEIVSCAEDRGRGLAVKSESLSRNEENSVRKSSERVELGGDAKDMLDVFLGPLLRKTAEEKKPEINLNMERDGGGSELLLPGKGREIVGLERETVKRKVSLRDRVALYLDT